MSTYHKQNPIKQLDNRMSKLFHYFSSYSYISCCINIFAFLKLIPYSVEWNSKTDSFHPQSSWFQKCSCASIHVSSFILGFLWLCISTSALKNGNDIGVAFLFCEDFLAVILVLYFIYFLWFQRDQFIALLNKMHSVVRFPRQTQVVFLFLILLAPMCAREFNVNIWRNRKAYAEKTIKLLMTPLPSEIKQKCNSLETLHNSLNYLMTGLMFFNEKFFSFPPILLVSVIITLESVWQKIKMDIGNCSGIDQSQGFSFYCKAKTLICKINTLFASPLLLIYILNLSFLAGIIRNVLSLNFTIDFWLLRVPYLFHNIGFYFLAARIHSDIQSSLKSWAFQINHSKIKSNLEEKVEMISYALEVSSEDVGVSCVLFNITYNTITSMFGLITTYTIITYPLEISPQSTNIPAT